MFRRGSVERVDPRSKTTRSVADGIPTRSVERVRSPGRKPSIGRDGHQSSDYTALTYRPLRYSVLRSRELAGEGKWMNRWETQLRKGVVELAVLACDRAWGNVRLSHRGAAPEARGARADGKHGLSRSDAARPRWVSGRPHRGITQRTDATLLSTDTRKDSGAFASWRRAGGRFLNLSVP